MTALNDGDELFRWKPPEGSVGHMEQDQEYDAERHCMVHRFTWVDEDTGERTPVKEIAIGVAFGSTADDTPRE